MSEFVVRNIWVRLAVVAVLLGLLSAPGIASGQSLQEQIIGAWRQVSIYAEEGGVKSHPYGDKILGLVVFDRSGYIISFLSKADLPKFAVSNRLKGTDAEYRAVVQGIIAGFGRYTIDGETVSIAWEASSFPNRAGTTEKRTYTIVGDEMTAVNPTASSGGTSYQNWIRVK
jgi:Lipocalin-like domain